MRFVWGGVLKAGLINGPYLYLGILRWFPVIYTDTYELSPLENAVETMQKTNKELKRTATVYNESIRDENKRYFKIDIFSQWGCISRVLTLVHIRQPMIMTIEGNWFEELLHPSVSQWHTFTIVCELL